MRLRPPSRARGARSLRAAPATCSFAGMKKRAVNHLFQVSLTLHADAKFPKLDDGVIQCGQLHTTRIRAPRHHISAVGIFISLP
eukprot:2108964-Pleurochrysis_carterae.AAC.1